MGAGADTVTTGAGKDVIRGTSANLNGDTITDFDGDDTVVIEDATADDIGSVTYGAGSAIINVNGTSITFDSAAFDEFDMRTAPSTFAFSEGAGGLRNPSRARTSRSSTDQCGRHGRRAGRRGWPDRRQRRWVRPRRTA